MSEFIGWIDSEYNIILDHNQEIVRCKDCKSSHDGGNHCFYWLTYDAIKGEMPSKVHPNSFCCWAERRDAE